MARDINLNSTDWCELVFEGKNKNYGAYEMRQTSSKRHLLAFAFTILFVAIIALIPQFMNAISTVEDTTLTGYGGPVELIDLNDNKTEEPEVIEPVSAMPPPPPMVNAVQYTPPVITDDAEVNAENEMRSQAELSETNAIISTVTYETENTVGVDPGELLREQREVTGTGTGGTDAPPVDFVEQMPEFPGGKNEMAMFLKQNLRYPTIAAEQDIQGRVIVKFVVGKTGKISDAKVLKGIDPSCDKEALRVVNSMPNWIPGMQNGNAVAVYFTLPILFRLN